MEQKLERLETEQINARTDGLDLLSTDELVQALHSENHLVALAVDAALPSITKVVDELERCLRAGGRLFYVGAGTSGRLGVLDASECPPTFGVEPDLIVGIIAGGDGALRTSVEGAEDLEDSGKQDLENRLVSHKDVVVGIAASGRTPYVIGALKYAKSIGAYAAAVVNVSNSTLEEVADTVIAAVTGPEPLTGSTRLKAGTAQKMILNMLTTAAMVKLGKVYGNLMVDMKATNFKLKDRALRIVISATGCDRQSADDVLQKADGQTKLAILMQLRSISADEARQRLGSTGGNLRAALNLN